MRVRKRERLKAKKNFQPYKIKGKEYFIRTSPFIKDNTKFNKGTSKLQNKLEYLKNGKNFTNHKTLPLFIKWGNLKEPLKVQIQLKLVNLNDL